MKKNNKELISLWMLILMIAVFIISFIIGTTVVAVKASSNKAQMEQLERKLSEFEKQLDDGQE